MLNLVDSIKKIQKTTIENNELEIKEQQEQLIVDLKQYLRFAKNISEVKKREMEDSIEEFILYLTKYVYRTTKINSDKDLFIIIDNKHNQTIKENVDRKALLVYLNTMYSETINVIDVYALQKMIDTISTKNYVKYISIKYDYHSKDGLSFTKKYIGKDIAIELKCNTLSIDLPEKFEIENIIQNLEDMGFENANEVINKVIDEYTNIHNPYYNDEYRLIVARQFASCVRNYIVYKLMPGGSGKTFAIEIRSELKINANISVENLLKNPSPLEAKDLDGKLVIDFDDKKATWSDELRNFMNRIYITPKYGFEVIFSPMLMMLSSADPIQELEGTVEIQNADRVNKFALKSDPLETRKMFKEVGRTLYFNIIGAYTYYFIMNEFQKYTKLSKFDATCEADSVFEEIYKKYGLKNLVVNLQDKLIETFTEAIINIVNKRYKNRVNNINLNDYVKKDPQNNNIIYIKDISTIYNLIVSNTLDDDFIRNVKSSYPRLDDRLLNIGSSISENCEITKGYKMPSTSTIFDNDRQTVTRVDLSIMFEKFPFIKHLDEKSIEVVLEKNDEVVSSSIVSKDDQLHLSNDKIEVVNNPTKELISTTNQNNDFVKEYLSDLD